MIARCAEHRLQRVHLVDVLECLPRAPRLCRAPKYRLERRAGLCRPPGGVPALRQDRGARRLTVGDRTPRGACGIATNGSARETIEGAGLEVADVGAAGPKGRRQSPVYVTPCTQIQPRWRYLAAAISRPLSDTSSGVGFAPGDLDRELDRATDR
jgi:hypothetical protein